MLAVHKEMFQISARMSASFSVEIKMLASLSSPSIDNLKGALTAEQTNVDDYDDDDDKEKTWKRWRRISHRGG